MKKLLEAARQVLADIDEPENTIRNIRHGSIALLRFAVATDALKVIAVNDGGAEQFRCTLANMLDTNPAIKADFTSADLQRLENGEDWKIDMGAGGIFIIRLKAPKAIITRLTADEAERIFGTDFEYDVVKCEWPDRMGYYEVLREASLPNKFLVTVLNESELFNTEGARVPSSTPAWRSPRGPDYSLCCAAMPRQAGAIMPHQPKD